MNGSLSYRLTVCNVICTLLVVYRHSLNFAAFYPNLVYPENYNTSIQSWIMNFSRIAVPVFFIISGFLFFKGYDLLWNQYREKIKKRFHSLFIPFVIWTAIGLFIMHLVHQVDVWHLSWNELVAGTYFGHLWYIRDLLLFVLLAPLFNLLRKNKWVWIFALLLLYWRWILVDGSLFSSEGVLFFLFGAGLTSNLLEKQVSLRLIIPLTFVWILLSLLLKIPYNTNWDKLYVLTGIFLLWQCSALFTNKSRCFLDMGIYCFFIYCGHFYLIKVLKLLIAHQFPYNDSMSVAAYLLLPPFVFMLLYIVGKIVRKHFPNFYKILSGGR